MRTETCTMVRFSKWGERLEEWCQRSWREEDTQIYWIRLETYLLLGYWSVCCPDYLQWAMVRQHFCILAWLALPNCKVCAILPYYFHQLGKDVRWLYVVHAKCFKVLTRKNCSIVHDFFVVKCSFSSLTVVSTSHSWAELPVKSMQVKNSSIYNYYMLIFHLKLSLSFERCISNMCKYGCVNIFNHVFLYEFEIWEHTVWQDAWMCGFLCRFQLKLFYTFQCGFYIYSVAALLFWETRRKDFDVMMTHHIVTISLIAYSYITGYVFFFPCVPSSEFCFCSLTWDSY